MIFRQTTPQALRDSVTEQLGYPCPVGLLDIKRAIERFDTLQEAHAYVLGLSENRTMGNGYYTDHRGAVVATGPVADRIRSLERELDNRDLHIVKMEGDMAGGAS